MLTLFADLRSSRSLHERRHLALLVQHLALLLRLELLRCLVLLYHLLLRSLMHLRRLLLLLHLQRLMLYRGMVRRSCDFREDGGDPHGSDDRGAGCSEGAELGRLRRRSDALVHHQQGRLILFVFRLVFEKPRRIGRRDSGLEVCLGQLRQRGRRTEFCAQCSMNRA